VGRLLASLAAHGVADDTLLWITSDNGPHCSESPTFCSEPLGQGRSNGGVRGCKASIWEGGVRVPGILHWPKGIATNLVTDVPAVTHDVLPTLLDLLGVPHAHPDWPLDGVSLRPFIEAASAAALPTRREKPIGFWWGDSMAWIDNDLKIIGQPSDASKKLPAVGQGCSVLPPWDTSTAKMPLLFNLSADPTESVQLAGEAALAARYTAMSADFAAWRASVHASQQTESHCAGVKPTPVPAPPTPPPAPTPVPSTCTFAKGVCGYGDAGGPVTKGVTSKEVCCALCLANAACTIAVWDGNTNSCHEKAPETKGQNPDKRAGYWACRARPMP
jgi:hypothetical protein